MTPRRSIGQSIGQPITGQGIGRRPLLSLSDENSRENRIGRGTDDPSIGRAGGSIGPPRTDAPSGDGPVDRRSREAIGEFGLQLPELGRSDRLPPSASDCACMSSLCQWCEPWLAKETP